MLEREKGREKGCVREGVRKIFDKIFFFFGVKMFYKRLNILLLVLWV